MDTMTETIETPAEEPARRWHSGFPRAFLQRLDAGVRAYTYRGIACRKSPVDLTLYLKVLFDLCPGTVIELGSHHGGSALFIADQCRAIGLSPRIYSVDLKDRRRVRDPMVEFVQADPRNLGESPLADLDDLPKPLLVILDRAQAPRACGGALDFFHQRMARGDVIVIEDAIPPDPHSSGTSPDNPNKALRRFLSDHGDAYRIMTEYADFFGPNVTYSPNGWLQRL